MVFSVVGWLAARGIDKYLAKWLAWIMIAWQNYSSAEAQAAFAAGINEVKAKLPEKAKSWEEWRARAHPKT